MVPGVYPLFMRRQVWFQVHTPFSAATQPSTYLPGRDFWDQIQFKCFVTLDMLPSFSEPQVPFKTVEYRIYFPRAEVSVR